MPNAQDVARRIGMWRQFRTWMADIPLADPLGREQAATLQSLIFLLILASLIALPLSLIAASRDRQVAGVVSSLVQALLLIVAAEVRPGSCVRRLDRRGDSSSHQQPNTLGAVNRARLPDGHDQRRPLRWWGRHRHHHRLHTVGWRYPGQRFLSRGDKSFCPFCAPFCL
jgi:hypothetical protein